MGAPDPDIEAIRALRTRLERDVLPLASSVDGRRFTFQASLHGLDLPVGGYALLESDGNRRLGQIHSLDLVKEEVAYDERRATLRIARGEGAILEGDGVPFHDAAVRPASPDEVADWMRRTAPPRARLALGTLSLAEGVPFALDAGGFDRHTFLCGQSGSGKTYTLGLVLEQLLLETDLRIAVLDPNSDHVRLSEPRQGVAVADPEHYRQAARGVVVHRAGAEGESRLRVRFTDLDPDLQAALLRLDPVADRDEYARLDELLERLPPGALAELLTADDPPEPELSRRARNLGLHRWGVWAGHDAGSTVEALHDPRARCMVADLGSLPTRGEQALAAAALLAELWKRRAERVPRLVVIDEAHNVCPAEPEDRVTELATEHAVRIAGEGRKFGIYLLVATQRPQKVHPNVLSQCDNLVLMKMNSLADLAHVGSQLSYAPAALVEQAAGFRMGETLVAGKVASHPAFVRVGGRISEEGGADVPADWARPR